MKTFLFPDLSNASNFAFPGGKQRFVETKIEYEATLNTIICHQGLPCYSNTYKSYELNGVLKCDLDNYIEDNTYNYASDFDYHKKAELYFKEYYYNFERAKEEVNK